MISYNLFSTFNKDSITYPVHIKMPEVFEPDIVEIMNRKLSFELGGEKLIKLKKKLEDVIQRLMELRSDSKKKLIPPNYIDQRILDDVVRLNLRDEIDEKLFWVSGVYLIVDSSVKHQCMLKFVFNNGKKYVDDKDLELQIT